MKSPMTQIRAAASALWIDERGVVISVELVLVTTVAILGLLAGLSAFRDAIVSEIDDAADSVGQVNQSYRYDEVDLSGAYGTITYSARTEGSNYTDTIDFCEDAAGAIVIDASTVQDEG